MKFIIGKKLEMTQIFRDNGEMVAVTKVQAGPCTVTQVKTADKDGYQALQFGYGSRKAKNTTKPLAGHLKGLPLFRRLRELRVPAGETVAAERGQYIDVSSFVPGDVVKVTATTKGRGFQGVVKRWGFGGSPATHGHKDQLRMPGSIGAGGPSHVFKGTRMGGHMGDAQVTVKNLEVIDVDAANNILYIKGGIPGGRNGLVLVSGEGEMEFKEMQNVEEMQNAERKMQNEENVEDVKEETVAEVQSTEEKTEEGKEELKEDSKEEEKIEEAKEEKQEESK